MEGIIVYCIVGALVWGVVWGVVTDKVIKNKGYTDNWFWWGFIFGFFALIVALTKPEVRNDTPLRESYPTNTQPDYSAPNRSAEKKLTKSVQVNAENYNSVLTRIDLYLEDGEWDKAEDYTESALDYDATNAILYVKKLMIENHVRKQEELADCAFPFDSSSNYEKAIRFGDDALSETLKGYISSIKRRNENARVTDIYEEAVRLMNTARHEREYKTAAAEFERIPGYKDADALANQCFLRAEVSRKDDIYADAHSRMVGITADNYEKAIALFHTIPGWKDADEQVLTCQRKIEEIKEREEAERLEQEQNAEKTAKKRKRAITITISAVIVCIAFAIVLVKVIIPNNKYNKAMDLIDSGDYDEAYAILEELGKEDIIAANKYDRAVALIDSGDYENAYVLLEEIGDNETIVANKYDRAIALMDSGDYENAYVLLEEIGDNETIVANKYDRAIALMDSGNYEEAEVLFEEIQDYKDSSQKATECLYLQPIGSIIKFGNYEQDNDTTNGKEDIEWLVLAKEDNKILVISKYALDCQQYNTSFTSVTWETCSLRKWLNGTFINNAFSSGEQSMIQTTTVTADKNPSYSTSPGNNTTDKVFLLSITEVNQYFSSDSARQCQRCQGTAYCYAQGADKDGNGNCWWWLRSPGIDSDLAAIVCSDGSVYDLGNFDNYDDAVRPALWINLGS